MDVVFLGADFKDALFPDRRPAGKSRCRSMDGRSRWSASARPRAACSANRRIITSRFRTRPISRFTDAQKGISLQFRGAGPVDSLKQAQDEVRALLRAFRHLRPQEDDNFAMQSSDTLVSAWDQLTGAIAAAAVGIVSVFMVVGGVVIMNIMLAVVSERTREIGVRKSVGARRQDIFNQFLVESSHAVGDGRIDRRRPSRGSSRCWCAISRRCRWCCR